ncbi:MAG: hypothetical protein JWQ90_188 [Hydrocarboniphaga sp.]|uniref:FAD-dependent oxidoreductase n=1 Tax=Hydrocarboniphaga sp. TaxID=2033016 RepID=UPI0026195AE7|nr:FAD-dependent oxidoreductase [Hydrocarboniphaga sp.]MDB5967738.1 hypothetical protein [Hydrocarboniphaga sp.]
MDQQHDYDVIVVGAGAAGFSAAIEAATAGAKVLLLECGKRVGGSTALSSGVIYAAGTEIQKEGGVVDTADAMFAYSSALSQNRQDASLLRRFCDDSAPLIQWLQALGGRFDHQRLYQGGAEPPGVRRSHRFEGRGEGLIELLERHASERSVEIVCSTRVVGLVKGEAGRVCGVRGEDYEVKAGAVVLACGGFGNNMDLVKEFYPEVAAAAGDWLWYIGNEFSMGDGLNMAKEVGAAIGNHNRGLIGLTHGFIRGNELFHPDWLVFVNRSGRRFVREFSPYGLVARSVMDQPGKTCFAIFDETSRKAAAANKMYAGLMDQSWTADNIAILADEGRIIRAQSLEELAGRAGIDGAVLASTVESYNSDCDAGTDTRYGKSPGELRPLRTPPFYAAEIRPAILAGTFTGVRIDREAQALDSSDRPIPGLYAAGETAASMGELYIGGGNAIANALVFGRVAGRNAANSTVKH